jgi:hypothetical protein
MGSRYEVVYPARGRQLFDGGLNNKFERSIINENESPDCLNVVFSNGAVGTRGGSTQLNTTAVGSFVCDGLYTRRDDTTAETMVAFFGGTMWQLYSPWSPRSDWRGVCSLRRGWQSGRRDLQLAGYLRQLCGG